MHRVGRGIAPRRRAAVRPALRATTAREALRPPRMRRWPRPRGSQTRHVSCAPEVSSTFRRSWGAHRDPPDDPTPAETLVRAGVRGVDSARVRSGGAAHVVCAYFAPVADATRQSDRTRGRAARTIEASGALTADGSHVSRPRRHVDGLAPTAKPRIADYDAVRISRAGLVVVRAVKDQASRILALAPLVRRKEKDRGAKAHGESTEGSHPARPRRLHARGTLAVLPSRRLPGCAAACRTLIGASGFPSRRP